MKKNLSHKSVRAHFDLEYNDELPPAYPTEVNNILCGISYAEFGMVTVLYEMSFEEFAALITSCFVVKERSLLSNKEHLMTIE